MNDRDITYRWLTEAELDEQVRGAVDTALDAAVRVILAMDPHIYDEDTVRAAAMAVRTMVKGSV